MSKKTKGKASANSMAKAAPAKPAASPVKPTPTPSKPPTPPAVPAAPATAPKVVPPPIKPVPQKPETGKSEKLRKEWQNLETWLKVRRTERDKKLNEARAKSKAAMGPQSRYRSTVRSPPVDVSALELELNTKLALDARAEWERRLFEQKLNEEDWIDITPQEMKLVAAAFSVAEDSPQPADPQPNLSSGNTPAGNLNNSNSNSPTVSPGGWTVHPSAIPTPSGSGLRQNDHLKNASDSWGQTSSSDSTESLWKKAMGGGTTNSTPNVTTMPKINVSGTGTNKPFTATPVAPTESLWEMKMKGQLGASQSSGNSPSNTVPTDPFARQFNGFSSSQQSTASEESLWEKLQNRNNGSAKENQPFPISREPSYDRWGWPTREPEQPQAPQVSVSQAPEVSFESLWETKLGGAKASSQNTKPIRSSPLATAEPLTSETSSEVQFGLRCPSLIEAECGESVHADEKGLAAKAMEDSIRKFYSMAAEREIQLRKKLASSRSAEASIFKAQLFEEFIQSVDNEARSVFDGWLATRLAAEEKQKAAQARTTSAMAAKRSNLPTVSSSSSAFASTSASSSAAQSKTSTLKPTVVPGKKQVKKPEVKKPVLNGKKKDEGPILEEISPANPLTTETPKETTPPRSATPTLTSSLKQTSRPLSPWAAAQKNKVSFASPVVSSEKVLFPARPGTPRASTPVQPTKAKNPYQAYVSDEVDEDEGASSSSSSEEDQDGLTTPEDESSDSSASSTSPTVSSPWNWMSDRAAGKQPQTANLFAAPARERKISSASDPRNTGATNVETGFGASAFWKPSPPPTNSATQPGRFSSQPVDSANDLKSLAMQNLFEAANSGDDLVNAMAMFATTVTGFNGSPSKGQPTRNNAYRSR
ncbi:hypothetical protein QCA50_013795 [Cerrena zonata]|uniref:Uncharacterized protein n=1 Tax=Cerrena zonata TaxID=2478898 RepID=A0AAW0FSP9_9APHY